jgi:hypothetical protein
LRLSPTVDCHLYYTFAAIADCGLLAYIINKPPLAVVTNNIGANQCPQ